MAGEMQRDVDGLERAFEIEVTRRKFWDSRLQNMHVIFMNPLRCL